MIILTPVIYLLFFSVSTTFTPSHQLVCSHPPCSGLLVPSDVPPSFNGCGGSGFAGSHLFAKVTSYIGGHEITCCCNVHDICFSTCREQINSDDHFEYCNKQFHICMANGCAGNLFFRSWCRLKTWALYTTVKLLSKCFYTSSQNEACQCRSN